MNEQPNSNLNPALPQPLGHVSRPIVYQARETIGQVSPDSTVPQTTNSNIQVAPAPPTPIQATPTPAAASSIPPTPAPAMTMPVAEAPVNMPVSPLPTAAPTMPAVDTPTSGPKVHILNRKRLSVGFSVLAMIAFASAAATFFTNPKLNKNAETPSLALFDSSTPSNFPGAIKPSENDFNGYKVANDMAKLLMISSINVKARVRQVSAKTSSRLMPPGNIYDVAWVDSSAKPGQSGATLIEGYDSSSSGSGIFSKLKKLEAGDKIVIEKGSTRKVTYKVVKTQTYKFKDIIVEDLLKSVESGKNGLNLMTCSGPSKNSDQRLVVFAIQQE